MKINFPHLIKYSKKEIPLKEKKIYNKRANNHKSRDNKKNCSMRIIDL